MSRNTMNVDERNSLETLEARLRLLLPEDYQDSYETMEPTPMRSAGLKYGADGKVAWNEIWGSFCDLAIAGGPPHKGTLLEAGRSADIDAQPDKYREVVEEICRGIIMAADLDTRPSPIPGWVRVECFSQVMAEWLLRAIVVENVAVRRDGVTIDLPAAPHFRLDKEIKNVVTVIAKTSHYWMGHMPRSQKEALADVFAAMAEESPLVVPGEGDGARLADRIHTNTGLGASSQRYDGWLGVECATVRAAVWMMRTLVVSNVLSRREGTVLFVPVNDSSDPGGDIVSRSLAWVHRLATAKGIL